MDCGPGRFLADLHIHSRFSRATSRGLDVATIYRWCRLKGIGLVSTADFTHPEWFEELKAGLEEDGSGFLKARPEVVAAVDPQVPSQAGRDVRFVISGEISSIYKKNGRTRKVHSLVFMPDFASAEKFGLALGRLGNVKSDGRPILGLDPLAILKLALDTNPDAFMIPAHVWTPHFSVFGAMSGFDTIEECFEDLTDQIFAVETGLSSDVVMNRRWSALDRFSLISSSDAHSPSKLGREATILDGEVSWRGLVSALKRENGPTRLCGTVEFFPEEGKYHVDGHRKCSFHCEPSRTAMLGGICPVCGKRLTPGVLGRVEQLADRLESEVPGGFPGQMELIPLSEVLAEIHACGAGSKKVQADWERLVCRYGSELDLIGFNDLSVLDDDGFHILAEGLRRMRAGQVFKEPGFDGEYGRIGLFGPGEIDRLQGQGLMFGPEETYSSRKSVSLNGQDSCRVSDDLVEYGDTQAVSGGGLTAEQDAAVIDDSRFVLVVAGPGTGKTRIMVARAARLIESGVVPDSMLVVTFTNRAAAEAAGRLNATAGDLCMPIVSTFHALALSGLKEVAAMEGRPPPVLVDDLNRTDEGALTLDGLVPAWVDALRRHPGLAARFRHVLVDEFQDISDDQYSLLKELASGGASLFCVGDPDQSIYGFRGAVPAVFKRFSEDFTDVSRHVTRLTHRLPPQVAECAGAIIGDVATGSGNVLVSAAPSGVPVTVCHARQAHEEAAWIAENIVSLVGGTDMSDAVSDTVTTGLGDIAVLARTHHSLAPVIKALQEAGLPFETASDAPIWHLDWVKNVMAAVAAADPMRGFEDVVRESLAVSGMSVPARHVRNLLDLAGSDRCGPAFQRLVLLTQVDAFGLDPERIHLLTIHASKGLEFDNVFVVGCNDGVIPLDSGEDPDEERRLLFVAVTRAKRRLFLSWADFGRGGQPCRSSFLSGLDRLPVTRVEVEKKRVFKPVQQQLF